MDVSGPRRPPEFSGITIEPNGPSPCQNISTLPMLNNAFLFLIIAVAAGILGFGVIAGTAAMIAKVFFVFFLILFVASFVGSKRMDS
jgi:uncharacterized membrane protein YtjA (UPF0391 family)